MRSVCCSRRSSSVGGVSSSTSMDSQSVVGVQVPPNYGTDYANRFAGLYAKVAKAHKAANPGHAVVLAGYDDEVAYLSDTAFEELQTTTLASLRQARHAHHVVFSLAGHMYAATDGTEAFDPFKAAPAAISSTICIGRD